MIKTEKLYYRDINKTEFEARVLEVKEEKKGYRVVLDKTCFFPEGGGQPADKGWINGIPVLDVKTERETIYHYLTEDPGTGVAKGKIDLQWRIDFMQQHTGQHIISGALWKVGKYKTVSVHMGSDHTTIEIDCGEILEDDLAKVENLANRVINNNLPIDFILTDEKGITRYDLRKPCLIEGEIRLVQIGDFDCVGCGGLHFASTGPVGLVKCVSAEKIRGHARLSWKIGQRAFKDYWEKDKIISELRPILGTREGSFVQKINTLNEEGIILKRKNNLLISRLADMIAQNLYQNQREQTRSGYGIITESWSDEDDDLIKETSKNLLKRKNILICLVNIKKEKVQWIIGCSEDVRFPF
ncbi:MAG: alanyl-tRNA editing protein, partial [Candidatus Aminicenantes bacterium]|nr:alanyl-tRNA editing protein [Candidatus Aminicenantes bacterium]